MKCPQCGREMQPGRIYAGGPLIWSPKENKLTLIRGKDDVDLSRDGPPDAWICRECHRVVMMY